MSEYKDRDEPEIKKSKCMELCRQMQVMMVQIESDLDSVLSPVSESEQEDVEKSQESPLCISIQYAYNMLFKLKERIDI